MDNTFPYPREFLRRELEERFKKPFVDLMHEIYTDQNISILNLSKKLNVSYKQLKLLIDDYEIVKSTFKFNID